ncbi:ATP-dependent nuclease [Stenotrophomonas sp. CCNWLW162]|uniref:ATP-dependent nuclease n=1 Tax=Stenotrophomonas sp. CCNWLW162 TaxID=3127480 RepID=UPI0030780DE3
MRIESVRISGFRCFGATPTKVSLASSVTAIIGPNAAGKTAVLQALTKLFGVSRAQRTIHRSDFHVGPRDNPDDRDSKALFIEVVIGFPELKAGEATAEAIAPSFRRMQISESGEAPVCRMRLEATWQDDGTVDGEVSQELYWMETLDDDPLDPVLTPVLASERALIQLYYTPASRDPIAQVKASAGALAARLLRAIEWTEATTGAVERATTELAAVFGGEPAIHAISQALGERWGTLHDEVVDTCPRLSLVSTRFEEVVNKIAVVFAEGPDGHERGLEALSDGQKSLFYFALVAAVFDLERQVARGTLAGFSDDRLRVPALSLFAIEEPENHLSPFFLTRIIEQARSLTESGASQALITSHSPAVLSRVEPKEVRYCRQDPKKRTSTVRRIKLPAAADEAAKFVRGALLAYPELYFARFVVLVEGDSERIVLPALARSLELAIDPAFVAIVPLGGRHVQHFWRLLKQLKIPYATLLDLDLGRLGGGFGRVKTAIEYLIEMGESRDELLKLKNGVLSDEKFAEMHTWQTPEKVKILSSWALMLRNYGVFFSAPLDLDLAMLKAFPEAYEAIVPPGGGPKLKIEKAAEVVLGTSGPGMMLYVEELEPYPKLFPLYRYHFLTHSKPVTHLEALTQIGSADLAENMPRVLKKLLTYIQSALRGN